MLTKRTIEHVLLVDDDEVYQMMVKYLFNNLYSEIKFSSLQETERVVQEIKDKSPQLLILDVNLPIQSGWELLDDIEEMLRKEKLNKPYIVMSSSSVGFDDREKARINPCVDAYIEKPLTQVKLKRLMDDYAKKVCSRE